jgi:hypothetical protein
MLVITSKHLFVHRKASTRHVFISLLTAPNRVFTISKESHHSLRKADELTPWLVVLIEAMCVVLSKWWASGKIAIAKFGKESHWCPRGERSGRGKSTISRSRDNAVVRHKAGVQYATNLSFCRIATDGSCFCCGLARVAYPLVPWRLAFVNWPACLLRRAKSVLLRRPWRPDRGKRNR